MINIEWASDVYQLLLLFLLLVFIMPPLDARSVRHSPFTIVFDLPNSTVFSDERSVAQRGELACRRSPSSWVVMLFSELESGLLKTKTWVFLAAPAAFLPKKGVFPQGRMVSPWQCWSSLSHSLQAPLSDLPSLRFFPLTKGTCKGGVRGCLLSPLCFCPQDCLLQCPSLTWVEVVRANDRDLLIEHLLCAWPWGETEMNEMQPPMTTQRLSPTEHD